MLTGLRHRLNYCRWLPCVNIVKTSMYLILPSDRFTSYGQLTFSLTLRRLGAGSISKLVKRWGWILVYILRCCDFNK